jgi:starvation-inducible DNA-binding protein
MKGSYAMRNNHDDGHNLKLQITIQPNIGLDSDARRSVVEILNHSLANEAVLTLKTRSAQWNVSGTGFFEMQTLFNSQCGQLTDFSDRIAERIRILGGQPIGSFEVFLKNTRLDEQVATVPRIMNLLADHEAAIRFLRDDAKKCSEEHEDEGTRDLLVSILSLHEKMAWVLRSHIEPELFSDKR